MGKVKGVCQNCGKEEVYKEGGVSKTTGKSYDGFWGCADRNCWSKKSPSGGKIEENTILAKLDVIEKKLDNIMSIVKPTDEIKESDLPF